MKIIHFMGMRSAKYGGLEQFNVELAKVARNNSDSITYVYEEYPVSDVFVDDLKNIGAGLLVLSSRNNYIKFSINLMRYLHTEKPDIIHAHFLMARFIVIPIALLFRVPIICQTFHGEVRKGRFSYKTRLLNTLYIKSRVISLAVSNSVRDQFARACKVENTKIRTQYLGVPIFPYTRGELISKYRFMENQITITSISPRIEVKGLDIIIKAVKILDNNQQFRRCKVIILGQSEDEIKSSQKLIDKYELSEQFVLMGYRNDIPQLLTCSDIYCQPSRSEGAPLAIMEALAAGLPVVASNVGGIPELVENKYNGILVESENVELLASALLQLIKDEQLRLTMGQNSKIKSKQFEISKASRSLYEVYLQEYR